MSEREIATARANAYALAALLGTLAWLVAL